MVACVAGAPHALARAQIPPSPSPFNAGHAGYIMAQMMQGEVLMIANRCHIDHLFAAFVFCLVMFAFKDTQARSVHL